MLYDLTPHDVAGNYSMLYDLRGKKKPHDRFLDIACSWCCRISDYPTAIARGVSFGKRCRVRSDVFLTLDDFWCFSERARRLIDGSGVKGFAWHNIVDDDSRFLGVPHFAVQLDMSKTVVKDYNICSNCGLPRVRRVYALADTFVDRPDDPLVIFTKCIPDLGWGTQFRLCLTKEVKEIFDSAGLRGFDLTEILDTSAFGKTDG